MRWFGLAFLLIVGMVLVGAVGAPQDPKPEPVPRNRIKNFPQGSELTRAGKLLENVRRNTGLVVKDALAASDTKPLDFVVGNVETIRIRAKGSATLDKLPPDKVDAKEKAEAVIRISKGTVLVRGSKAFRKSIRFRVEGPLVSTAARGTSFAVSLDNGRTKVVVAEGIVRVSSPTDPNDRVTVRHGQKVDFEGGDVPLTPQPIEPADYALYAELLSLPGTGDEGDLQNDIAGADISELYVKRWDLLGRWMANGPPAPDDYDDDWRPDFVNLVRYDRPPGTADARRSDRFVVVDEEGNARPGEPGWHMQALSPDGQTILASNLEKGTWAFDWEGKKPSRKVSSKALTDLTISPDGLRYVGSVGWTVDDEGIPKPEGKVWVVGRTDGSAERVLITLEQRSWDTRVTWFQEGKRLFVRLVRGGKYVFLDGDSPTPRELSAGRDGSFSPKTGAWLAVPGFENSSRIEVDLIRTSDGKVFTFTVAKPLTTRQGGQWTVDESAYLVNGTTLIRTGANPAVGPIPQGGAGLRLPKGVPAAFSPDGRFFAYVEEGTWRLIVADSAAPHRIFDTAITLFDETELRWKPVGDTIAYRRRDQLDIGPRPDVAGEVELGAIKLPAELKKPDGTSDFTANPRDDAITFLGPASFSLDLKATSAGGLTTGAKKAGLFMDTFVWDPVAGLELLQFDESPFTAGIDIAEDGTVLANTSARGSTKLVWRRGQGATLLPPRVDDTVGIGGGVVGFNEKGENGRDRGVLYVLATGQFIDLSPGGARCKLIDLNERGAGVLMAQGPNNSLQFFATGPDGARRPIKMPTVPRDGFDAYIPALFVTPDNQVIGHVYGNGPEFFRIDARGAVIPYATPKNVGYMTPRGVLPDGRLYMDGQVGDLGTPILVAPDGTATPLSAIVGLPNFKQVFTYSVSGNLIANCVGDPTSRPMAARVSFLIDLKKVIKAETELEKPEE